MDNNFLSIEKQKIYSIIRYMSSKIIFEQLANMTYAVIKGEPLSCFCYNKYSNRISNDIDILTTRNFMKIICKSFFNEGFQYAKIINREEQVTILSGSHQLIPLYKRINNFDVNIDLNFDVFWGEYTGKRIDIDNFLSDTIEMEIYGCHIKTLPPLKAMVQLILHHYKEMNSIYHLAGHNCINYNMFKDVYFLWKNDQEAISLENLYNMSSDYEIIPFAFYILYFTNQIFNDLELEKYVAAFKTTEGVNLLDYYGLAEKERKPWKVDFQTRLGTENLFDLIKDDLATDDIEKLEKNRRMFG